MKLPPAKKITYQSGTSKNGKLLKRFKPSAFCDTSFLLWSEIKGIESGKTWNLERKFGSR